MTKLPILYIQDSSVSWVTSAVTADTCWGGLQELLNLGASVVSVQAREAAQLLLIVEIIQRYMEIYRSIYIKEGEHLIFSLSACFENTVAALFRQLSVDQNTYFYTPLIAYEQYLYHYGDFIRHLASRTIR